MILSALDHWKEPTTRCSICGRNVTLELSKTDDAGKAVHEWCYVLKTLSKYKTSDETTESWPMIPAGPVQAASEPVPSRMHWRIFGLVRW
jgi:hypothetical protein